MIAANGAMARFLDSAALPSIRRVVKAPERWQRIVALAQRRAATRCPPSRARAPSPSSSSDRKQAAPDTFADLSLSVVKLMGPGEYALERPGEPHDGHFGLAVTDYTHSTAPNRRFADLGHTALVKAALGRSAVPVHGRRAREIAAHCTQKENDARKVERTTRKQAAALLLSDRIGQSSTQSSPARPTRGRSCASRPAGRGRVVQGEAGLDVGDHVRVRSSRPSLARGSSTSCAPDAARGPCRTRSSEGPRDHAGRARNRERSRPQVRLLRVSRRTGWARHASVNPSGFLPSISSTSNSVRRFFCLFSDRRVRDQRVLARRCRRRAGAWRRCPYP